MEKNIKKGSPIKIFNFNASYVAPKNTYNKSTSVIEWGDKNLYPNTLLELYNVKGSSTHKSIINKKVKLISGNGFNEILNPDLQVFIDTHSIEEEVKKATLDYEIFNGFAFEVIWNNEGTEIVSMQHIPIHKLRYGFSSDKVMIPHFWFSNNWAQYKKEEYTPEYIRAFNPNVKQGKQVYFYSEYNPESDGLYPIAGYSTSINWISLDYEISVFHLNQLKQGYSPSFILNFATGIPTEEEQDEFFKDFKKNFSGAENSGKIILTYSEGVEQKPELTAIQLNDSDKRFTLLKEQTKEEIVTGHEVPAAMVLLTAGKLGSTQERAELMVEFNQSYVGPRQENISKVLNNILKLNKYGEEVSLKSPIEDKAVSSNFDLIRSSVGGITALMQLQASVASGITSRSSALGVLELIYGFSIEESNKLLGDVEEGSTPAGPNPTQAQLLQEIKNKL